MINNVLEDPEREQRRFELEILRLLGKAAGPIGASVLLSKLESQFSTSEPTIGRKLRELDREEYTRKVARRGRVITDKGRKYLNLLNRNFRKFDQTASLLAVLDTRDNRELLIEVLEARHVLETHVARQAAVHITEESLEALRQLLAKQQESVGSEDRGAEEDVQFHHIIARSSGNRVLERALALIRSESQLSPYVARIRGEVSSRLVTDHEEIYQALAEHDPEGAAAAMGKHIKGLIADVKKYWQTTET